MSAASRTRTAVVVAALAAMAVLTGCGASGSRGGDSSDGDTNAPIKILAIADSSGAGKQYGTQELIGLKAAAQYYNGRGGVDGHKIEVTTVDDGGEPATATSQAVKALTGGTNYTMVYPGSEGTETAALIPVMKRFHQFAIPLDDGNNTCVQASACPNTFVLNGPTRLPSLADAQWIARKGFKRVGIVYEQVAFTQSEIPPLEAGLRKAGVKYAAASFPASATDITPQVQQLKASGAQMIFGVMVGAPAGYALQARAKLGWKVPLLFDNAASSLDLTKLASDQSQLTNSYITVEHCADPRNTSQGLRIAHRISSAIRTTDIPCNLSGNGWDAVVTLADLVKQAHSLDGDDLTKAAESAGPAVQNDPLQIVNPHVRWSSTDHENQATGPFSYPVLAEPAPIRGAQNHPTAGP